MYKQSEHYNTNVIVNNRQTKQTFIFAFKQIHINFQQMNYLCLTSFFVRTDQRVSKLCPVFKTLLSIFPWIKRGKGYTHCNQLYLDYVLFFCKPCVYCNTTV